MSPLSVSISHLMCRHDVIAPRERTGFAHIIAFRQSLMGMTPSFSPSNGMLKREKASLISVSCAAVMLCSFASLDGRATFAAGGAAAGGLRLGG